MPKLAISLRSCRRNPSEADGDLHPAQAELKMQGIANVGIHNLSPGMVTTELLMSGMPG